MKILAKRTLSLLLAVLMVLSLIPAAPHVHAEEYGATWTYGVSADGNYTPYDWLQGAFNTADGDLIYGAGQDYDWTVTLSPTKASATCTIEASLVDANGDSLGSVSKEVTVSRAPSVTTIVSPADFPELGDTIGVFTLCVTVFYNGQDIARMVTTFERSSDADDDVTAEFVRGFSYETLPSYTWLDIRFNTERTNYIYAEYQPYDWTISVFQEKTSADLTVDAVVEDIYGAVVSSVSDKQVTVHAHDNAAVLSASDLPELTDDLVGNFILTCTIKYNGEPVVQAKAAFSRTASAGTAPGSYEVWHKTNNEWINISFNTSDDDLIYEGADSYDWYVAISPTLSVPSDIDVIATIVDANGKTVSSITKAVYGSEIGRAPSKSVMVSAQEFAELTNDLLGTFTMTCNLNVGTTTYAAAKATFSRVVGCEHSWLDGYCQYCGKVRCYVEDHTWSGSNCQYCGTARCDVEGHSWGSGDYCDYCGAFYCDVEGHSWWESEYCDFCGAFRCDLGNHFWSEGEYCDFCGVSRCELYGHEWLWGEYCDYCGTSHCELYGHQWGGNYCDYCSVFRCDVYGHNWSGDYCDNCGYSWCSVYGHDWMNSYCNYCGIFWCDVEGHNYDNYGYCLNCGKFSCTYGHSWWSGDYCDYCGAFYCDVYGHSWYLYGFSSYRCDYCDADKCNTEGHNWYWNGSYYRCEYCNLTRCDVEGHAWVEATCTAPRECKHCTATEGSALGHSYFDGVCSVCNCPDGIEYIISNGEVTITKYTGSATVVVIPATIAGYPVTTIGGYYNDGWNRYSAFEDCDNLTSVTLPESVTTIGAYAFYDCDGLSKIILPESVTTIGECAFYSCQNLLRITIPDSVTTIDEEAFRGCTGITRLTIGSGVTTIGFGAFASCSGLTAVSIPGTVVTIEGGNGDWGYYGPFADCTALTQVTIGDGITAIVDGMFSGCSNLNTINIPSSVTTIGDSAFQYCHALTSIAIPNSVTSIGDSAFYSCTGLTGISIPDSVTTIGSAAFRDCYRLASVDLGSGLQAISDYAFYDCDNMVSITIPDNVTTIGYQAFYNCYRLANVTTGNGVTTIGNEAFYDCYYLNNVQLGSSVTTIGNRAFANCPALAGFTIPANVTTIGDLAFTQSGLATITIPDTVTFLGWDVFRGCTGLTSATIGSGISTLDVGTFTGCTNLVTVTIPATITTIGEEAFDDCQNLETVYYLGTQDQWDAVSIGSFNDPLRSARVITADVCAHNWISATCTIPKHCNICFEIVGSPIPHDMWETTAAVAATCENSGRTAVLSCSLCGYTEGSEVIPALGHDYLNSTCVNCGKEVILGDADSDGKVKLRDAILILKIASGANIDVDSFISDFSGDGKTNLKDAILVLKSSHNHSWASATCTEPMTCSHCHATAGTAKGHDWIAATLTTPKTCKTCGMTEGDVASCDHQWTAATCIKPKTCQICHGTEGEANGHNWEASDMTCNVCQATATQAQAGDEVTIYFTAENPGLTGYNAVIHYDEYGLQLIDIQAKSGTADVNGNSISVMSGSAFTDTALFYARFRVLDCAMFGKTYAVTATVVEAYDANVEEVTLTINGGNIKVADCKHIWGEWTGTEATCGSAGELTRTCTICGTTETYNPGPNGYHQYGNWTFIDEWYHEAECAACGSYIKENHTWDSGVITVEPTVTEDGVRTFTCAICGGTKNEVEKYSGGGNKIAYTEGWETDSKYTWLNGAFNTADEDLIYVIGQDYDWDVTVQQNKTTVDVGVWATITDVNGNIVGQVNKTAISYKSDEPSVILTAAEFSELTKSLTGEFTLVCDVLYKGAPVARMTQTFSRVGTCSSHSWDEGVLTIDLTGDLKLSRTYTCTVCGATKQTPVGEELDFHTASVGDEVIIQFTADHSGLVGYKADIHYDANALDLISISVMSGTPDFRGNTVALMSATAFYNSLLFTATFEILDSAEFGAIYEVSADVMEAYDSNVDSIDLTIHGGVIAVGCMQHDMQQVEAEIPVSCETSGRTAKFACSFCGETEGGEVMPATGHNIQEIEPEVHPSCTADGKTAVLSCMNCGLTEGGIVIPTTGDHVYAHILEKLDATCTTDGYAVLACGCGVSKTEYYPMFGHNIREVESGYPASCEYPGMTAIMTCANCGLTSGGEEIPAFGHDIGTNYYGIEYCKNCDLEGCDLGIHYWIDPYGDYVFCARCEISRCYAEGHYWLEIPCVMPKTCQYCKMTIGSVSGHNYVDGICTNCDVPEGLECYVFGDEMVITDYTGNASVLVIPATIAGKPVTAITGYEDSWSVDGAFQNCDTLTTVILPDSLITIGENAFYDCDGLSKIVIPEGVTSIGDRAFYSCESLLRVDIPDSVIVIGNYAFSSCSSLTRLTFGNGVTTLGENAFASCSSLASVKLPNSLTTISNYAFYNCRSLISVTIPDSVTAIGDYAFSDCYGLTRITIPDSVTTIGNHAFDYCNSLTSITIPDSVTTIGNRAFYGCNKMSSVDLGNGLQTIGDYAFSNCYNLTGITIPDAVTQIGYRAFNGCTGLTSVTIGNGLTTIGNEMFYDCTKLTNLSIGSGVTTIGNRAFAGCSALATINIPANVTTIGDLAFARSGLATITIPDTVTYLGWDAFRGCTGLTSVSIGSGISALDVGTFIGCTNLTSVTIPATITSIGDEAFDGCQSLATVNYLGTQEQWNAVTIGSYNDPLLRANVICLDSCEHIWIDATCTEPKTCTLCGDTQGAANGHNYVDGICSVCNLNVDALSPSAVVSLIADAETLYPGDTVTVTVSASPIENVFSGGFLFNFDSNVFEYVGGESLITGFDTTGISAANGNVAGYFMNADSTETVKGTIFQITLRVKENASLGDYTISGDASVHVVIQGNKVEATCTVSDASVTVACKHVYGAWIPLNNAQHKHVCTICSHEEIAYIEYTVTFQYADGTIISTAQYHYGDTIAEPDAPTAPEENFAFAGWDKTVDICTGNAVYTAQFVKFIPGDIDGDDAVTYGDAVYLLLHALFGEEQYPLNGFQGDIDGNGVVDHEDAIYLLLHTLFGADFYPLNMSPAVANIEE